MDVLSPLFHLGLRSLVVLFPLTVGVLAFRRLALSKSANAWVYAAICLFAAVTAAGILPWTLGLTPIKWPLVTLALLSPGVWIVTICYFDVSRMRRYEPDPLIAVARVVADTIIAKPTLPPLVLQASDTPTPTFRHHKRPALQPEATPQRSLKTQSVLKAMRDIRGNRSSDQRRPKLLPPPERAELPFLKRTRDA
ncbi:MAG: hypothetical protein AAGA06_07975 [Pseudomonadota bacterium]